MSNAKPLIGISMGDPAGIGPEIAAKALNLQEIFEVCRPIVIGEAEIMKDAARFSGLDLSVYSHEKVEQSEFRHGVIDVLDLHNIGISGFTHKSVSADCGRAAFEYVKKLIELAMDGQIDATVTAPINKEAINAAGFHFAGHTEIYAYYTNTADYAMMLVHKKFRVIHVSTHVSLKEACNSVKKERVLKVIQLAHDTLLQMGIREPSIGVAGLNPHCGEGGLFGQEETEEIKPAINEALTKAIRVDGPIPADTIFPRMEGGLYDVVVVMYHDQGHIPIKLIGFHYNEERKTWRAVSGVNITCGLPIIRVSVDHGTAFGKAGEGRANPDSIIEAIYLAVQLAR